MMKLPSIGGFTPKTPFFLAPMAGFTDGSFRRLCEEMGAGLTYTEMVSAKGLIYNDKKSRLLLDTGRDIGPVGFQIFGSEPDIMARAVEKLSGLENVLFDVNMGCPVPKVVKNGDGSALLRKPELIYEIIKAMKGATDKPVTAKIRIGIQDAPEANRLPRGLKPEDYSMAVEAARAIEEAGGDAVCVHGRTREQYYSGRADLMAIKAVKDAVSIPVIGNGDVLSPESAREMMEVTGAELIALGRGALGNPWIFRKLLAEVSGEAEDSGPDPEERRAMIIRHYRDMEEEKGEYAAVREMRKFVPRYLRGIPGSAAIRSAVNGITDGREFCRLIEEYRWEEKREKEG